MKAVAMFPKTRQVAVIDHDPPPLTSPTQVKVRMLEVGICGTDKEIAAFQYGTPPRGAEYLVLGHESLGEVAEVGAAVTRVKRGDLAVLMVRRPCPHPDCLACRAGRQDFCYTGDFRERGIKEAHGFMTEWVVDEERYLHPVPAALREVAVLVEPLTIAEKALIQVNVIQSRLPWDLRHAPMRTGQAPPAVAPAAASGPGRRHRALVIGAGPVGLLGAMALVKNEFTTWVYSQEEPPGPKSDIVAAIGATYVCSRTVSVADLAKKISQIDLVYEATGASNVAFAVMKVLGTNGVFVFTGVPGRKGPITIDTDLIMRNLVLKNQITFGTVNASSEAFAAAISDLQMFRQRWPKAVAGLITGRYPLEQYADLLAGKVGGIKNVIAIDARRQ